MKKKNHVKLTKKGMVVIAGFTAVVVTAGVLAVKFVGNDSKSIEVSQTQVAVAATTEKTQASAPAQTVEQTTVQAQESVPTQTTAQAQEIAPAQTVALTQAATTAQPTQEVKAQATTTTQTAAAKEKRITTKVDAKAVLADPDLNICIKTKSTSFQPAGATVLEPQIDLRLVSKDGKINTWTSINNNGDLYNANGQRFKGVGDGTFYDVNGVIYDVVQVSKVVK